MKTKYTFFIPAVVFLSIFIQSCEMDPDPGFDGQISGKVTDNDGKPVCSNILANTILVNALGEGDVSPIIIRIDGKGLYKYTTLFPKKHKVWITGPVYTTADDTVNLDFSGGRSLVQDFVVQPYITINLQLKASPTDSTITVTYSLTGNQGKVITARAIYCGTSPYPTSTVGTGPYYQTFTKSVTTNSGETKFTGLKWGTRYYVRMGANGKTGTANDLMNYSEQIVVNIPAKTK